MEGESAAGDEPLAAMEQAVMVSEEPGTCVAPVVSNALATPSNVCAPLFAMLHFVVILQEVPSDDDKGGVVGAGGDRTNCGYVEQGRRQQRAGVVGQERVGGRYWLGCEATDDTRESGD